MTPEKLTFLQMFMAFFNISDIYLVGEERGRPLLIISIVIKDLIAPSKLNFFKNNDAIFAFISGRSINFTDFMLIHPDSPLCASDEKRKM